MINDEAQARRLARAICSDVLLYNEAVKGAPREQRATMLAEPLEEGRELFTARVAPSLGFVFHEVVEELIARPLEVDLRGTSGPPAPAQPPPTIGAPVVEVSSSGPLLIGVVVLIVVAAAAAFFFFR